MPDMKRRSLFAFLFAPLAWAQKLTTDDATCVVWEKDPGSSGLPPCPPIKTTYRYPKPKGTPGDTVNEVGHPGPLGPNRNEQLANRIADALGNDPHVVLEIRPNGDGTFRVLLSPEAVRADILRILEER
jgi:hypothetical protein